MITKLDPNRERYVVVLYDPVPEGVELEHVEAFEEYAGKVRIPCHIHYTRLRDVQNNPKVKRVEPVILHWTC